MRTKGQLELAKEGILELLQFPRLKASLAASISTSTSSSTSSSSDFFKLISNPKGILLLGESGVGKSSLVHEVVCSLMRLELVSISAGELLALPHVGAAEEMLREAFQEAEEKAKENGKENIVGLAVVFINHIDLLCKRRDEADAQERRLVGQLLTLMDGLSHPSSSSSSATSTPLFHIFVIATSSSPNMIDTALRRPGRFDKEIEIRAPDATERLQILQKRTETLSLHPDLKLDVIAGKLVGYVLADLEALCREAGLAALTRIESSSSSSSPPPSPPLSITTEDFEKAMKRTTPSALRGSEVNVAQTSWSDIGGLEEVKQRLKEAVEWPLKHASSFERLGLRPTKGILLHGPAGCSKTTLVKAIANASQAAFLKVDSASVFSPFFGDAEKFIRDQFKLARQMTPCILFFDEIDAVVGKRSSEMGAGGGTGVAERVLSTLLNEMDGIQPSLGVLVIAATNRLDMLDPALLRPNRIDQILYIPRPDHASRVAILRVHTAHTPLALDRFSSSSSSVSSPEEEVEHFFQWLADQTMDFSGADLENLCREAALISLREDIQNAKVSKDHFLQALNNHSSVTR